MATIREKIGQRRNPQAGEHHSDAIRTADHVMDLGPEAGQASGDGQAGRHRCVQGVEPGGAFSGALTGEDGSSFHFFC